MSSVRVIAGSLKGRVIPFSNQKYGNAEITPQKVKGAVFSMIGEDISGRGFLDLFACSGQMGIEALSRGAKPVIFCEPDKKKFAFIRSFTDDLGPPEGLVLINDYADRAVSHLGRQGVSVDYVYVDPPYDKAALGAGHYATIVLMVERAEILGKKGHVIIQHFSKNNPDERLGHLRLQKTRKYGTTSISLYGFSEI